MYEPSCFNSEGSTCEHSIIVDRRLNWTTSWHWCWYKLPCTRIKQKNLVCFYVRIQSQQMLSQLQSQQQTVSVQCGALIINSAVLIELLSWYKGRTFWWGCDFESNFNRATDQQFSNWNHKLWLRRQCEDSSHPTSTSSQWTCTNCTAIYVCLSYRCAQTRCSNRRCSNETRAVIADVVKEPVEIIPLSITAALSIVVQANSCIKRIHQTWLLSQTNATVCWM